MRRLKPVQIFAPMHVSLLGGGNLESIMNKEYVNTAEMSSQQINTHVAPVAQSHVQLNCGGLKGVKLKSVRPVGFEPVYNMYVENTNCYSVNGGLILHNCDSLRYALYTHCGHGPSGIVASIMV